MRNFIKTILALCLAFGLSSCKKIIDFEHEPANLITEFKVPVSDGFLYGAVDDEKNEITLYLPFYYELSFIDPQVRVSSSAKLKTELKPISVIDNNVFYVVEDGQGNQKTYKLSIVLSKMGKLSLSELSTKDFTMEIPINSNFNLDGFLNTTDIAKVRVTLVDEKGVETAQIGNTPGFFRLDSYVIIMSLQGLKINPDIAPGLYRVKVKVYDDSVLMVNPVKLTLTQPTPVIIGLSGSAGSAITVSMVNSTTVGLKSFKVNVAGTIYDFPIVSKTASSFVVKIPDGMPKMSVIGAVNVEFEGWSTYSVNTSIVIS